MYNVSHGENVKLIRLAKQIIRRPFSRFLAEPERILGIPPLGGFWSSISVPLLATKHLQEELDLAQLCLKIGIDSLNRDLRFLANRARNRNDQKTLARWRGEHYKFLTELSIQIQPNLVVEIGTHRGIGSLALMQGSNLVVTYDIFPWNVFPDTALNSDDFGYSLRQIVQDLSDENSWRSNLAIISSADIVFLDGPKNAIFEKRILPKLLASQKHDSLLIIDDIRFLNMRELWEKIIMPKFDATSVAHYSGTGVVRICRMQCCIQEFN